MVLENKTNNKKKMTKKRTLMRILLTPTDIDPEQASNHMVVAAAVKIETARDKVLLVVQAEGSTLGTASIPRG